MVTKPPRPRVVTFSPAIGPAHIFGQSIIPSCFKPVLECVAFVSFVTFQTFDILTSEFGAWPSEQRAETAIFYKLDFWEDALRRRSRLVKNPLGSTHPEAILEPVPEEG